MQVCTVYDFSSVESLQNLSSRLIRETSSYVSPNDLVFYHEHNSVQCHIKRNQTYIIPAEKKGINVGGSQGIIPAIWLDARWGSWIHGTCHIFLWEAHLRFSDLDHGIMKKFMMHEFCPNRIATDKTQNCRFLHAAVQHQALLPASDFPLTTLLSPSAPCQNSSRMMTTICTNTSMEL